MNLLSYILLTVLLVGSMVHGYLDGTSRRSRLMVMRKIRQGPGETVTAAMPWSLVKSKMASNGKTLDESFTGRRKRQAFHDVLGDPSFVFSQPTSEHGTFNQDTYSCDDIMSRPCNRPSDCHGCLGLFTCHLPQGRCDFKSVSKRTGVFYQSLQNDETSY